MANSISIPSAPNQQLGTTSSPTFSGETVTNDASAAVDAFYGAPVGVGFVPGEVISQTFDAVSPGYVEFFGDGAFVNANSSGNCAGVVEASVVDVQVTGAHNYDYLLGEAGYAYHKGTGTVGQVTTFDAEAGNAAAGTVTQLIGFRASLLASAGTITNAYGVDVELNDFAGTISAGLYGVYVDVSLASGPAGKTFPFFFGDSASPGGALFFVNAAGLVKAGGGVIFPTADPHVTNAWWNNAGTLTRSTG